MNTLRQIISVVTRKRISKIEIFDKTLLSTEDSKFTQLYNAIESDVVKTDQEASDLIYGDENSANYRKLKSRFLKRLLNTLFFLDINGTNKAHDWKYNHYQCTKALMHAKLLRFFGAFASGVKIIKLKYNDAEKFAYYDLLTEYSWFLLQYYCLTGNEKSLKEELSNYRKYSKIAASESESQLIYYSSIVGFVKSSAVNQKMIDELKKGIIEIERVASNYPTGINMYHEALMKTMYFEAVFDWESLLVECDKSYQKLLKYPNYFTEAKKAVITLKKFVACLNLRMYDHGIELFIKSKLAYDIGSPNWYLIHKYGVLLALHAGERKLAYETFITCTQDKVEKFMSGTMKEFWSIIKAYCFFLVKIHGEEQLVDGETAFQKFRLYKFLNEVPIYSRDKSGNNVALLIIQYMFFLMNTDYEAIIQKMDSLKVYRSRYLKGDDYKRAYTFIGMLIKVEKDSFLVKRVKKTCAKDYNMLLQSSKTDDEDSIKWPIQESEIIPYERLWFYILKILEYNDLPPEIKNRQPSIVHGK